MWSVKCEVWSVKEAVRSEKCEVWSVKCGVWSAECEVSVWSAKSAVWSVKCEVWGLECEGSSEKWEVWSVKCGVWSAECEVSVWSAKSAVLSVKCEVWGLECEGSSEKWEVWSVDCEVWSVECEVWSLECEECSVKCGVWSVKTLLRLSLKKSNGCRGKDTVGTGCLWTIGHLCLGNFRRRLARVYVISYLYGLPILADHELNTYGWWWSMMVASVCDWSHRTAGSFLPCWVASDSRPLSMAGVWRLDRSRRLAGGFAMFIIPVNDELFGYPTTGEKNTISSSRLINDCRTYSGVYVFLVDTWNLKPLEASLSKQCSSQWANVSCRQRPCTWSIVSGGNRSLLPVGIIPIVKFIASPIVSPSYPKQGFNPMYTHNYVPRS